MADVSKLPTATAKRVRTNALTSPGGGNADAHPASSANRGRNDARTPSDIASRLSSITDIVTDIRDGKMVIIVDDADRENEGDLIMAADKVGSDDINFMARHGRGLICLTLERERCEQLGLELMTQKNTARYSTNFTVSIEAAEGVTTGISAADRATTVKAAVRPEAVAEDIVTPGHIFPLMAQSGGVLNRAGHTEAGIDLARLAGRFPASVICEVLNEDGTMARLEDLLEFGQVHGIKVGTIADLIRYRLENEPTVIRLEQHRIDTHHGPMRLFAYQDIIENDVHLALVAGEIGGDEPVAVRVHAHQGMYDAIAQARDDSTWAVADALEYVNRNAPGVVVLLRYDLNGVDLLDRIRGISDVGTEPQEEREHEHLRVLGLGSQILADLGVHRMHVLGSSRKTYGLDGFGLIIEKYISQD